MGYREYDGEIFKYLSNILHTSFKLCYIILISLVKVDLENRLTTEYKVLEFLQIYNLRNVLGPINYIFEGVIWCHVIQYPYVVFIISNAQTHQDNKSRSTFALKSTSTNLQILKSTIWMVYMILQLISEQI